MLANPIVLTPPTLSEPVNFDFAGIDNNASTYRVAPGTFATIANPCTLKVSHQQSKVGTLAQTRRSLVRLDRVVGGADGSAVGTISAYAVLSIPERIASVDEVADTFAMLGQALSTANQTKIINQEL